MSGAAGANASDLFGGGLGDIFEAFFGGNAGFGGGNGRRGGPVPAPRGQDLEVRADLSFRDAVFGTTLPVKLRTYAPCDACAATGAGAGLAPVCQISRWGLIAFSRSRRSGIQLDERLERARRFLGDGGERHADAAGALPIRLLHAYDACGHGNDDAVVQP